MKSIMVLGQRYRIKRIRGLMKRDGLEGYVESHKFLIGIDSSLKGLVFKKVLYHEAGHAFAFETGLHEFLSPQALELFCQSFAAFITQLP